MMPAAALALALLIDACLGEPKWLWSRVPHPAILMGQLVKLMDEIFNKPLAGKTAGVLTVIILTCVGATLGVALSLLGPVAEILCAAVLLAQKSLVERVRAVAQGLRSSPQAGRVAVSMIVSRDTDQMNESQIARSAIESAAENLSDGVIAPAFWFLIAGLPGIIIYKIINTADSMIGYKTEKYLQFGWAAARLDDLLNLVPARLTCALIGIAGGLRSADGIARDAKQHLSPNAGWPEAAMARVLNIALAGPRVYDGTLRQLPWVNQAGRKEVGAGDIDAAISLLWKAWGLTLGLCALLSVVTWIV